MAKKWEKVGGGSYGVYREKKTDWGSVFGAIIILGIIVAVFAG